MLHTVRRSLWTVGRFATLTATRHEAPLFASARDALALCELEKSPDYLHTYRVTPVSVWNAAAVGVDRRRSRCFTLRLRAGPRALLEEIEGWIARYGLLRIERVEGSSVQLVSDDLGLEEMLQHPEVGEIARNGRGLPGRPHRARSSSASFASDSPSTIVAGTSTGSARIGPGDHSRRGPFGLRDYQANAADAFHASGRRSAARRRRPSMRSWQDRHGHGGHGLVGAKTLILTTNTVAVRQWRDELGQDQLTETRWVSTPGRRTSSLSPSAPIRCSLAPLKSASSNTSRSSARRTGARGLRRGPPPPRADLPGHGRAQARRLGLTATLVREDGKEEIFCLIGQALRRPVEGPRGKGFIAEDAASVRPLRRPRAIHSASSRSVPPASENPAKDPGASLRGHGERILVIGQYLDQLKRLARRSGPRC